MYLKKVKDIGLLAKFYARRLPELSAWVLELLRFSDQEIYFEVAQVAGDQHWTNATDLHWALLEAK